MGYTNDKGEPIKEAYPCRHCGKIPFYKVDHGDPQVMAWHRIRCENGKCPVCPSENAMNSKDAVLTQWNKRMACSRCKEHESLLMILNGRLDATRGHSVYTRKKMADHYEKNPEPDLKGKCVSKVVEDQGALIHNREHNYTLKDDEDTLWLTVGDLSVEIKRRDDGVSVALLPPGDEADGPVLDAAFAQFSNGQEEKDQPPTYERFIECDRCHKRYDEAKGDGYCGLCPKCADETEPEACQKCGTGLVDGFCTDVTCPYSDRKQHEEFEEEEEGCPNCDGTGRDTCPMCEGTNKPFPEEG